MTKQEDQKRRVGYAAANIVKDGTIVGIGTGSTVLYFIQKLGERTQSGKLAHVRGVATSKQTEELCARHGIPMIPLAEAERIDLAVDGADEVDRNFNLTKGGAGALHKEKLVDYKANRFIVIIDEGKKKDTLGKFPLPVEVKQRGWQKTKQQIEARTGCRSVLRGGEKNPYLTDNGNYILDCQYYSIPNPANLETLIHQIPGVFEVGIFPSEYVSEVWVGTDSEVLTAINPNKQGEF